MRMDSSSAKDLSVLIREITWRFGARGLKGECCGDLSQPEYRALCLASERPTYTMKQIANELGFTKGGATRVVNRLEKKGYIKRQRSAEDGRVCCVQVTSQGSMLVKSVSRDNEARLDRIMSKIDPGMRVVITTALRSFVEAIQVEE